MVGEGVRRGREEGESLGEWVGVRRKEEEEKKYRRALKQEDVGLFEARKTSHSWRGVLIIHSHLWRCWREEEEQEEETH